MPLFLLRFAYSMSVNVCCTMMLPLSRRVTVFLYCNISELNRATKGFFSVSLTPYIICLPAFMGRIVEMFAIRPLRAVSIVHNVPHISTAKTMWSVHLIGEYSSQVLFYFFKVRKFPKYILLL